MNSMETSLNNFLVKNKICKSKNQANIFSKYFLKFINPKGIKKEHSLIMKNLRTNSALNTPIEISILNEIEDKIYYSLLADSFIKYFKKNGGLKLLKNMPSNAEAKKIFDADEEVSVFASFNSPINFDELKKLNIYNIFETFLSFHSFSRDMLILSLNEIVGKYDVCKFDTVRAILKEIKIVIPNFIGRFDCLGPKESSQFYKNIGQMQMKYTDKFLSLKGTDISKFID